MDARVAVDGHLISAAGVTAGLDAALARSLSRGEMHSGTPESAPNEVLKSFQKKYPDPRLRRLTRELWSHFLALSH